MISTHRNQSKRPSYPTNLELANSFREVADLLERQGANPFRVRAYRRGAETIDSLPAPLWQTVVAEGADALTRFPTIGQSLAKVVGQMVRTGRLRLLERLRGEGQPERIFTTVAEIGPKLAQRIHEQLHIETLTELEAAAYDGRLAQVPGMGRKRLRAVRETLSGRFRRPRPLLSTASTSAPASQIVSPPVPITELLDLDRQYRELAAQGRLPRVSPRRFNPTGEAWLPILHTQRGARKYTVLFSNTAHAHEMGATHDWVLIYQDAPGQRAGPPRAKSWTVITAHLGQMKGKRIVRGREEDCRAFYELQNR